MEMGLWIVYAAAAFVLSLAALVLWNDRRARHHHGQRHPH